MIHLTPSATAPDPNGSCHRVNARVLYEREIDDQAVITHTQTTGIVASASKGYKHTVLAAEIDCGDNVRHIRTLGDQAGRRSIMPL